MAYNTISIETDVPTRGAIASGTIYPGMLVELTSASADTVQVQATAGRQAAKMFAVENELVGGLISTAYASASRVMYKHFRAGDKVYCRILDGQNIAKGDLLVSGGSGYMRKLTEWDSAADIEQAVLLRADEACDMSGSAGVDPAGLCVATVI